MLSRKTQLSKIYAPQVFTEALFTILRAWEQEEKGRQRMRWLDGSTDSRVWASSGRYRRTGKSGVLRSTGSQRVGLDLVTEHQQNYVTNENILRVKKTQKLITMRAYSKAQGNLLSAQQWPRREGNPKQRECLCIYGWFTLPYRRHWYSSVKQLYI